MEDLTFEDCNSKDIEVYEFERKFVLYIYGHDGNNLGAYFDLDKARVLQQKLTEWIDAQSR